MHVNKFKKLNECISGNEVLDKLKKPEEREQSIGQFGVTFP